MMRSISALYLYRVAFGAIAAIPIGYFVFAPTDMGPYGAEPIQWWIKFRPGSFAFWLLFGAALGTLWHLIEKARISN
jgi:hypothetical protein